MRYYDKGYEEWYLERYQAALKKIGHLALLNLPKVFREKLMRETDLIRKVRILEEIASLR